MSNKTVVFYMFNMINSLDNIFPCWKMVISSHQHERRRRRGWKKMVIDRKLEVRFEKYTRLTLEICTHIRVMNGVLFIEPLIPREVIIFDLRRR